MQDGSLNTDSSTKEPSNLFTPYTPHPTPYTLHPAPHTFHPAPYTLHLTPCPFTLLDSGASTLHSYTLYGASTLYSYTVPHYSLQSGHRACNQAEARITTWP